MRYWTPQTAANPRRSKQRSHAKDAPDKDVVTHTKNIMHRWRPERKVQKVIPQYDQPVRTHYQWSTANVRVKHINTRKSGKHTALRESGRKNPQPSSIRLSRWKITMLVKGGR